MTSEPRFSNAMVTPPKTETKVVNCIVLTDRHGDTHAFAFDRTPTRFGAVTASFSTITAQVHEWSQTQPFDKGEKLTVATSALTDPGAARLDKHKLTWGEFTIEGNGATSAKAEESP